MTVALCVWLPAASALDTPTMSVEWQPEAGDTVLVDTSRSIVYLVHADGEYYAMDALTGQRRVVAYDGIVYNARTPERDWELRTFEKKGRSITFGEGRFGRLYWPGHEDPRRGDEGTAYGFHSHLSFAKMLQDKMEKTGWDREGTGHRSMGCILLSEENLTLVQRTWEANGGVLQVRTRESVEELMAGMRPADGEDAPSWLGWLGQ